METPTFLPPTTTISPLFFLWQLSTNPLKALTRLARESGDIAHIRIRRQDVFLLNHPDLIEQVLVKQQDKFTKGRALQRARILLGDGLLTSEGEEHLIQRRILQPSFQRKRIEEYLPLFSHTTQVYFSSWKDGQHLNISDEMMYLTLDIALWAFFGNSPEGAMERVNKSMRTLVRLFPMTMLPLPDSTRRLFPRFKRAIDDLALVTEALIAYPTSPLTQNALIHLLKQNHAQFTDDQVQAHALTFLLAGHETTALLLAWALDMLAHHPEAQEKLHAEVDSILNGQSVTKDALDQLIYTRAVVNETLRLRPPAWMIGRQSVIDCEIGGYTIPAGSTVLVSPWITQRDARYFHDPEVFRPERWASQSLPRFTYFPFGGGSRVCIGEHFAMTEAITVLALLARAWDINAIQRPSQPNPSVTLRPRSAVTVQIASRK